MKFIRTSTKFIRTTFAANFVLLGVFASLPVLLIKPDVEFVQMMLNFITKE